MTPTPSGLVGRDRPLAELQALVEAVLASRGGLVALTGEAGIGKTTLATAAADHAEQRGATVVWGACWEGAPPFWPWLEALAALGVDAGIKDGGRRSPSSPAARFERFHAVSSALLQATGPRPLVVVLDDLHWADPASVELAAFHARRARRSPQLLVATYRDVEVPPGDPDQRDRTAELLGGVRAEAERRGLDGLAVAAAGLLGEGGPAGPAEFRRAGAGWTLTYAGRTVRLPDAKGMGDLAVLLSRPGRPVPAAELVALSGGGRHARAMGADPVLDEQAKQAYRRRLQDLDREVADAEDQGDPGRVERARSERDAIAGELAAALGLGGRGRGLGDPAERARKAVTERIRYSMARVARAHPELAAHLEASVTTGSSCAYVPAEPVTWLT
jgi:AAA ATPase domain